MMAMTQQQQPFLFLQSASLGHRHIETNCICAYRSRCFQRQRRCRRVAGQKRNPILSTESRTRILVTAPSKAISH
jgi:hypothetical protein